MKISQESVVDQPAQNPESTTIPQPPQESKKNIIKESTKNVIKLVYLRVIEDRCCKGICILFLVWVIIVIIGIVAFTPAIIANASLMPVEAPPDPSFLPSNFSMFNLSEPTRVVPGEDVEIGFIDKTKNKCSDFYGYSCGNFDLPL